MQGVFEAASSSSSTEFKITRLLCMSFCKRCYEKGDFDISCTPVWEMSAYPFTKDAMKKVIWYKLYSCVGDVF